MIIELGHYALVLALLVAILQSVVAFKGATAGRETWMMLGHQAAITYFGLMTVALTALMHAFALSDFSVLVVASNSHTMKPALYKIAALWGNHEGSMLLWVWILALWGAIVARHRPSHEDMPFKSSVLAVLGMMSVGFTIFVLMASNPFTRLDPAAVEGLGLNPVLQDPLLAIHPPLLYMGYVGFSVTFAFAAAALLRGKVDAAFARMLRPWVLGAWSCLTVGIALGSFWAYYELGWGGFWFWDPVENASLMPWLAGTALLHSVIVLEKRETLKNWTLFMAILTFSLSLLGTFLVRSGVLTSVHAFASDPMRGIFILGLLGLYTGGGLFLYALRAPKIEAGAVFALFSRETAILLNNVFLFTFTATVFIGTLYPVFTSALGGDSISVGAPYFTAVMAPLLIPFAILMGGVTVIAWRDADSKHLARKLMLPITAVISSGLVLYAFVHGATLLLLAGVLSGVWILSAGVADVWRKRSVKMPAPYFAMHMAHAGFALMIIGAAAVTQLGTEKILWMSSGEKTQIAGKDIFFDGVETGIGSNYNVDRGVFRAEGHILGAEKRWYPVSQKSTSEASLQNIGLDILYVVLGDQDEKDPKRWVVRLYYHPLLLLIYIGAAFMALGGFTAAVSRRRSVP